MDQEKLKGFIGGLWDKSIIPALEKYIAIPNISPSFDPDWEKKPDTENVVKLMTAWVEENKLKGMTVEVVREAGRTPLICIEVEGTGNTKETIMMYGHLDKQPPTDGWLVDQDIHPYKPTIKDGKLYGRGGADDGYAIFSAVSSLKALQEQGLSHARVVILIEASEESGSPDLMHYVEKLKPKIGKPSLIICLDSGCGTYDQLWITTSLRGFVRAPLTVQILNEGVHSGHGSGIVPSSFRILRNILTRVEDPKTGKVDKAFQVEISKKDRAQAKEAAQALGDTIFEEFPWTEGSGPVSKDLTDLLLNRTWRAQLEITGAEGLPDMEKAGNVLRPQTTFMLSLRIPPTLAPEKAAQNLKDMLERQAPYGAKVTCTPDKSAPGWAAPEMQDWLLTSVNDASNTYFGKPACYMGEGGSIPFMGMLGEMFPEAQFVITGVLGPKSNAHGPNEFLHIQMAKNLTCCVSSIVLDHFNQTCGESNKKAKTT